MPRPLPPYIELQLQKELHAVIQRYLNPAWSPDLIREEIGDYADRVRKNISLFRTIFRPKCPCKTKDLFFWLGRQWIVLEDNNNKDFPMLLLLCQENGGQYEVLKETLANGKKLEPNSIAILNRRSK